MHPHNQYRLKQKEPHLLILIIMSSFATMGAVIFTPALPEIAHYFQISAGHSQLTITLFLLGYAVGQLLYGPLSNRYGRKPAFYIGIVISTIGSLISITSEPLHSFWFLILGRMLEALGSSAGLVIAFTIINDHYYPHQARRIIAYLMLAFAIVPGIATFLGGILVTRYHWISCFYFLLFYGLLLAFPASLLKETAISLDPQALHFKQIIRNYYLVFKNKLLRDITFFFACSGACVYIYLACSPFIAIHDLEMSPEVYGLIGLFPFAGTIVGSLISARLSNILPAKTVMGIGYMVATFAVVVLSLLFYLHFINFLVLIISGFIFMLGNCLLVSCGSSIATSTVADKANASAVMNFINVGIVTSGTFVTAVLPGSPTEKLPVILFIAMGIMGVIWKFLLKKY